MSSFYYSQETLLHMPLTTGDLKRIFLSQVFILRLSHWQFRLLRMVDFFPPNSFFPAPCNFSANLSFEPFVDVFHRGFISPLHQMNQIWEHVGGGNRENSPAEVTLCLIIAPALLYIHQSAVSYLGQLCPQVIRRPQGTRYFGTRPLMPPQTWITNSPRNDLYSQGFVQKNECTFLLRKQNSGSSGENTTTYDDILFELFDIFSHFKCQKYVCSALVLVSMWKNALFVLLTMSSPKKTNNRNILSSWLSGSLWR